MNPYSMDYNYSKEKALFRVVLKSNTKEYVYAEDFETVIKAYSTKNVEEITLVSDRLTIL